MTPTQLMLSKEYTLLERVFGATEMSIMFNGLTGYFDAREESTFFQVRDELINLKK